MQPSSNIEPQPAARSALLSTALAALLGAAVLLPLLGHKPLTDWDEGIYAEVSREMLGGSWIVPHWNLQLWLEKPPLMLWITAGMFKLLGISELAARLGSALSGVALVSLLHLWLERRAGRVTAWLSSIMLLATFGFQHVCRVGEMDALLSFGCVLSLIGLTEANESRPYGWILFWAGAACSIMTKGAAAAPIFVTAALLERWSRSRFDRRFWLGLALCFAVVMPWHLAMYVRFGHQFVAEYFGLHVWSRATEQIEGHTTAWWFYLKVILVSAPPFALLYPAAAVRAFRTGQFRVFALFGLVVIVFYSIVRTRLPHYIAPCYPAFTAITAAWLTGRLGALTSQQPARRFWVKAGTAGVAIYAACALVTAQARSSLHTATLANGVVLPDNKEAVALLRQTRGTAQSIAGPLLVLRKDAAPINTDIFYSRLHVQQVELADDLHPAERNRYTNDPIPLVDAITTAPVLLLLDTSLEPRLPVGFVFHPLARGRTLEFGTLNIDAADRPHALSTMKTNALEPAAP